MACGMVYPQEANVTVCPLKVDPMEWEPERVEADVTICEEDAMDLGVKPKVCVIIHDGLEGVVPNIEEAEEAEKAKKSVQVFIVRKGHKGRKERALIDELIRISGIRILVIEVGVKAPFGRGNYFKYSKKKWQKFCDALLATGSSKSFVAKMRRELYNHDPHMEALQVDDVAQLVLAALLERSFGTRWSTEYDLLTSDLYREIPFLLHLWKRSGFSLEMRVIYANLHGLPDEAVLNDLPSLSIPASELNTLLMESLDIIGNHQCTVLRNIVSYMT